VLCGLKTGFLVSARRNIPFSVSGITVKPIVTDWGPLRIIFWFFAQKEL
jgi:hypothetical protein